LASGSRHAPEIAAFLSNTNQTRRKIVAAMPRRFRNALRAIIPLLAVQLFLVGINIATELGDILNGGRFSFWAIYPLLAMAIPQFIIVGMAALAEDKDEPGKAARVAATQFSQQATPMVDASLRDDLIRVRTYRAEIERLLKTAPNEPQRLRLQDLSTQFEGWQREVERMAERISAFRRNAVVQNDLQTVPVAIRKLLNQIEHEKDANVKVSMERTLATRSQQWGALQKLQSTMRHAEVQFESTVSSLGTVYSQALAGHGTNQVADYSHLAAEVNEQVGRLNDQLNALEEVKLGRAANLQ
jgi:hypothetical protein